MLACWITEFRGEDVHDVLAWIQFILFVFVRRKGYAEHDRIDDSDFHNDRDLLADGVLLVSRAEQAVQLCEYLCDAARRRDVRAGCAAHEPRDGIL